MANVLISICAFLVAIGILVTVHEWGHFIVARLAGVKVLRFSIGFGRPLWTKRAGPDGTEYCISAIPIGGYVKLLDERDCDVSAAESHRTFNAQPLGARIAILSAGPLLNFIFAVLVYWAMFIVGVPGATPVLGEVRPDSLASQAGLAEGDRVIRVGSRPVATWEGTVLAILDEMLAEGDVAITVQRPDGEDYATLLATAGRESELTEPGALFDGIGIAPWSPVLPPVLDEIVPGGTAESAGLKTGDRILAVGDRKFERWSEWVDFVRERPGETLEVSVLRDGRPVTVELAVGQEMTESGPIGRIGATVRVPDDLYAGMRALQRYGPGVALIRSLAKTWEMAALTVRMVVRMVTGDVSIKNISGPINIAQYAGYSAQIGLAPFLNFLAIVSISLGILNLLPVPMLDGGQIAYQLAEAVRGRPLSERAQLVGQQMGILLLLLLMSFAFYNDLARIFG